MLAIGCCCSLLCVVVCCTSLLVDRCCLLFVGCRCCLRVCWWLLLNACFKLIAAYCLLVFDVAC